MKATVAIWPIQFSTNAGDLGALKSAMERDRALVIAFLTNNDIATKEIARGLPDVVDRQDERIRAQSPITGVNISPTFATGWGNAS
jgi:hypothetical protein